MKVCSSDSCSQVNPQSLTEFYKKGVRLCARCKSCVSVSRKLRYKNNKEKSITYSKNWRRENKEKYEAYNAEFKANNLDLYRFYYRKNTSIRRAEKLHATPIWLTEDQKNQISRFYSECPKGYQVDHIVPLRGKDVRGLHVPWNLQYLTKTENCRKSNKL